MTEKRLGGESSSLRCLKKGSPGSLNLVSPKLKCDDLSWVLLPLLVPSSIT